jgi:hypothetical protein
VPERAGVDAFDLGRLVAEQFAQPRVLEQEPAIFIDYQQGRGAELHRERAGVESSVTLFLHKIGRRFMCGWVRRETGGTRQSDLTPR